MSRYNSPTPKTNGILVLCVAGDEVMAAIQWHEKHIYGKRSRLWFRFFQSTTCTISMLVFFAGAGIAQSTSQLNGSVTDQSGATIVGASITLTNAATGLQRGTTSGTSGLYQVLDVPPGKYQLKVTGQGFAPFLA
jgi:hypothetical protein